jgi:membrane protein implicated in regulation of membrane protease activity
MLLLLAIAGLFFLPSPWGIVAVCVAAVVEVGEYFAWQRFLRRYRIRSGPETLVGAEAEVVRRCDPLGQVRLRGELWRARCDGPLEPGEVVRVAGIEGLTLLVEPANGPGTEKGPG